MKKLIFLILFLATNNSILYSQEENNIDDLRYAIKALYIAELVTNIKITDSNIIYCLLNGTYAKLDIYPLNASNIFKLYNYTFYVINWFLIYHSSCIIDHENKSWLKNSLAYHYNPNTGFYVVQFKIAVKPGSGKRNYIYRIDGFYTSDLEKIMFDVLNTKSKRKVRRMIKRQNLEIENLDLLELIK